MRLLSGFVNTNYLFSMTEEDADKEQEKLYRLKHIIHIFNIGKIHSNIFHNTLQIHYFELRGASMEQQQIITKVYSGYREGPAGLPTQTQ